MTSIENKYILFILFKEVFSFIVYIYKIDLIQEYSIFLLFIIFLFNGNSEILS